MLARSTKALFYSLAGPVMALKMEAIGLAIAVELPIVIVDVQRGGPSTGLPTKNSTMRPWNTAMCGVAKCAVSAS